MRKQLEQASPDLLLAMVKDMAEALMGAEADALCGAPHGKSSPERVDRRNGYPGARLDASVGSIDLAVPRSFARAAASRTGCPAAAPAGRAGVRVGDRRHRPGRRLGTRRVEKLVQQRGVEQMSKSQVSRLAKSLDQIIEDFRTRPLDGAPTRTSPSTR